MHEAFFLFAIYLYAQNFPFKFKYKDCYMHFLYLPIFVFVFVFDVLFVIKRTTIVFHILWLLNTERAICE